VLPFTTALFIQLLDYLPSMHSKPIQAMSGKELNLVIRFIMGEKIGRAGKKQEVVEEINLFFL